jgi:hypothetical protein
VFSQPFLLNNDVWLTVPAVPITFSQRTPLICDRLPSFGDGYRHCHAPARGFVAADVAAGPAAEVAGAVAFAAAAAAAPVSAVAVAAAVPDG